MTGDPVTNECDAGDAGVLATGECNRVLPLLDFMAFLRCEDATVLEPRIDIHVKMI